MPRSGGSLGTEGGLGGCGRLRKGSESKAVLEEIYKPTQEECAKGWMRGPYKLGDIPFDSASTPMFGVTQTSSDASKGTITKVRPKQWQRDDRAPRRGPGCAAPVYRHRCLRRLGKGSHLLQGLSS